MTKLSVAVVIPAFRSRNQIIEVLESIPSSVDFVFVIDDACPENTGDHVILHCKDPRVEVIKNNENLGVGGAVIVGLRRALETDAEIIVKLDSDGQMNPQDMHKIIEPIVDGRADYAKGNRFNSLDDLQEMPKRRIFGNAVLSLMSKLSTGYWSVTDPTNGYLAFSRGALEAINLGKLRQRWFFESDILFRLAIVRAVVADVPIKAKYANERSNLKISKVVFEFINRHNINFLKRILYVYYLREWSVVSFELPASIIFLTSGFGIGLYYWQLSASSSQAATVGQVMLAVLPVILGFQLLVATLTLDLMNEPKNPIYVARK